MPSSELLPAPEKARTGRDLQRYSADGERLLAGYVLQLFGASPSLCLSVPSQLFHSPVAMLYWHEIVAGAFPSGPSRLQAAFKGWRCSLSAAGEARAWSSRRYDLHRGCGFRYAEVCQTMSTQALARSLVGFTCCLRVMLHRADGRRMRMSSLLLLERL